MTITDVFSWLDAHPTSSTILGVVVCWLALSLLSLVENPRPGSTLALVVEGVKRWGVDLPGTARWIRTALTHVQGALTGRLLARAGVEPGTILPPPPAQEAPVYSVPGPIPEPTPSTAPTPIPGVEVPPAIEPAPSPPRGAA